MRAAKQCWQENKGIQTDCEFNKSLAIAETCRLVGTLAMPSAPLSVAHYPLALWPFPITLKFVVKRLKRPLAQHKLVGNEGNVLWTFLDNKLPVQSCMAMPHRVGFTP